MYKKTFFERLLNFCLGASWALVVIGALYSVISVYGALSLVPYSFIYLIFAAFFGSIPGLFFIVIFEYIIFKVNISKEQLKQTELLEEIVSLLKKDAS